jgi:hypothetical protein
VRCAQPSFKTHFAALLYMVYNDTSMRKSAKNPQANKTVFLKDRVNVNVNEVLT